MKTILLLLVFSTLALAQSAERPQVAVYYFPNYHPSDARNAKLNGPGWSEWELVKSATPRFPGQHQPNVPAWGYTDESDPKQMAQKIDAAADHGINAFIFDWYYYDDGPFLERGLEQGFLKASNASRMKFALMWANHDWVDLHPARRGVPQKLLFPGRIKPETWDRMTDYVIATYFKHPSHWMIDGKPYFSVYDLSKLMANFGSVPATRAALDRFREKAIAAGFPGLHLNAVVWGRAVLPVEKVPADPGKLVRDLGFDSVTSYVWIHHVPLPKLRTDYNEVRDKYLAYADNADKTFAVPYYPNVSMGWDPTPRTTQTETPPYKATGYPYTNTICSNTPGNFKTALQRVKDRLMKHSAKDRILTINAWNEWTEGSYLEPDRINGMGYLDAIQSVFGNK